ncbi:MAG: AlpA family transcriptional regulator [Gammaproteobacteria bacterium]|nr:AlpA family transcriptional regulator [Gammaproteobacteria bacterium]
MDTLLRLPKVIEITGLGRSTIYRLMGSGEFPHQVAISRGAVGWRKSDIEAWIESRKLAVEARAVRGLAKKILTGEVEV